MMCCEVISARILLCDLAGSERLKKSDVGRSELQSGPPEVSGEAQKEAIEINKWLTRKGNRKTSSSKLFI